MGDGALRGLRVAVTRPSDRAGGIVDLLEAEGAVPAVFGLIGTAPPVDPAPIREAMTSIDRYDWVVFTSAAAVHHCLDVLDELGGEVRHLARARIAVVGPATAAALGRAGLVADAMPAAFRADAIPAAMAVMADLAGARVLWPRAEAAREVLSTRLTKAGARVDDPIAYRTAFDAEGARRLSAALGAGAVDVLTFASPSAVDCLIEHGGPPGRSVSVAVIGPVTARRARRHGLAVEVVADPSTAEGLVRGLVGRFGRPA
jgi:uroporphyrinogen-III synthase